MRNIAFALLLLGCSSSSPFLSVDLATDLVPGVEFTRVRTELGEAPFGEGPLSVQQIEHEATDGDDYGAGVRVAEITPAAAGIWYLRVSLVDASGRIRGQRLATVEINGSRAVTIVIGSACSGVVCPGNGDPEDAIACVNGACVPATCTPESPETCPPVGCESDDQCGSGLPCHRPACASGTCLALDACSEGQICTDEGCAAAPFCGDGTCDSGSETPCACSEDCGACPPACDDGVCDGGELPESCPEDCGPPPSVCGDRICEVDEPCTDDCPGTRPTACGDPGCTSCEECDECCDAGCGDGACNEPAATCPLDCGAPATPVCGDTRCDIGESCSADCRGSICGDGMCDDGEGESCGNCQDDCGWCGLGLPAVPFVRACVGRSGYRMGIRCSGLSAAWTDSADNVAYYPMATVRETPFVTGEASGQVVMLAPLTPVGVQSTRNPLCHDSPPLRPAIDGWVFGYLRGMSTATDGIGWLRIEDLLLDPRGGPCADGPNGGGFQVFSSPYSRDPICEQFDCDNEQRCRDANPIGEGATECDGVEVDYERIVDNDSLVMRYSPAGSPRRFLHRGDRVRVRYESPDRNYLFVVTQTSASPLLTPVGSRGWVNPNGLRAP